MPESSITLVRVSNSKDKLSVCIRCKGKKRLKSRKNNISKSAKKEMTMVAYFPQLLIIYFELLSISVLSNRLSVDRNER